MVNSFAIYSNTAELIFLYHYFFFRRFFDGRRTPNFPCIPEAGADHENCMLLLQPVEVKNKI